MLAFKSPQRWLLQIVGPDQMEYFVPSDPVCHLKPALIVYLHRQVEAKMGWPESILYLSGFKTGVLSLQNDFK